MAAALVPDQVEVREDQEESDSHRECRTERNPIARGSAEIRAGTWKQTYAPERVPERVPERGPSM